ncbi:MAG: M15 family metallopeptidase [Eubacteriales bacterium]|nr:M15 family metallopeptidase [Eubacteriales bacterium]MDD4391082.1 M15 family metallopeptidase [Eubacteriales bacterium]
MDGKKIGIIIVVFTVVIFLVACIVTFKGKNLLAVEAGAQQEVGQKIELEVNSEKSDIRLPVWEPSGQYVDLDKLILVNKQNPVGKDFIPKDLVRPAYRAQNRNPDDQYLTREAADALDKLACDALGEGHEIVVTTAYRSYNLQNYLYNNYVKKDGKELADKYSAQPGKSEHQTGLAVDVSSPSVNYKLVKEYGNTTEGKWLAENSWKYGFIIRYLEGQEDVTGYTYEPWHLRYVGQEAATVIKDKGITLEEYLNK